mgnify:CR=1 FL=1
MWCAELATSPATTTDSDAWRFCAMSGPVRSRATGYEVSSTSGYLLAAKVPYDEPMMSQSRCDHAVGL